MRRRIEFRSISLVCAVGALALLGSPTGLAAADAIPQGQDTIPPADGLSALPNVDASAEAAAAAGPRLDLLSTTYARNQLGGGVLKPGKSYRTTDLRTLVCPTAKCTIRYTAQVQLEGNGNTKGNDVSSCYVIGSKVMNDCTVQGQVDSASPTMINTLQFQTVKKGTYKVYGAIATRKGAKIFLVEEAWDIYK